MTGPPIDVTTHHVRPRVARLRKSMPSAFEWLVIVVSAVLTPEPQNKDLTLIGASRARQWRGGCPRPMTPGQVGTKWTVGER
jgi:hypothetical protein